MNCHCRYCQQSDMGACFGDTHYHPSKDMEFKFLFVCLLGKKRNQDRGRRNRGTDLSFICRFPKCLQQPGLGEAEARRKKFKSGLPHGWGAGAQVYQPSSTAFWSACRQETAVVNSVKDSNSDTPRFVCPKKHVDVSAKPTLCCCF